MNCKYVREYYNVPAEIGRIVEFEGRKGIIAKDGGSYIGVNFNDDKPGSISNLHPTYKVKYLGLGKVRQMTRSQRRYKDYIDSEYEGTFSEWMNFK